MIIASKPTSAKLEDNLYKHLMMVPEFKNLSMDAQGQIVVDLTDRIKNNGEPLRKNRRCED